MTTYVTNFTTHARLWPHMSLTLQHTHVYDHICHYFTCSKFSNLLVATSLYHHTEFTFFSNIWLFPYNVWYMLQFLSSSHLHIQINVCTKYCITYCNFSIFCGGEPVSSYRAYFSKKMFGCVHAMYDACYNFYYLSFSTIQSKGLSVVMF